jgi:hypothetical protein
MSWGSGDWGASAWGEGETSLSSTFFLNDAIAIAENRVRLTFSGVPYYSRLFDLYDGSDARRFVITEVAGTSGMDGNAVRLVTPAFVEKVIGDPVSLDVILDRPMTPYPAQYIVTVTGVATGTPPALMLINASSTTKQFFSTYKLLNRPVIETGTKSRDFASPQTRTDAFDPLPNPNNPLNLGTFPVDDTGDYAFDEGLASFKKRVIRRIISRKNSFAHIPEYGFWQETWDQCKPCRACFKR